MSTSNQTPPRLQVNKLYSSGMVLQRDHEISFRGTAALDCEVHVNLAGRSAFASTQFDGSWEITLASMPAGGPFQVQITAADTELILDDVWIGDVFLLSGQSNMLTPLARVAHNYPRDVAACLDSCKQAPIRYFKVPDCFELSTQLDEPAGASWQALSDKNLNEASALAHYFASELYTLHKVPLGLVVAAVGGAPIKAFLGPASLADDLNLSEEHKYWASEGRLKNVQENDSLAAKQWAESLEKTDLGLAYTHWSGPDIDDSQWSSCNLPNTWQESGIGDEAGVVWYRRELVLPPELCNVPATIHLGTFIDSDQVYVNGIQVGSTGYRYPPRHYQIPSGILHEGTNTLCIRLVAQGSDGACFPGKPWYLEFTDAHTQAHINLCGLWKYKRGASLNPLPPPMFANRIPGVIFNGMLAPALNLAYKAVVWYQGESDTDAPELYKKYLHALMLDWSARNRSTLVFFLIQISGWGTPRSFDAESAWARLRQVQLEVANETKSDLVMSLDAGEWNDLHPLDKKTPAQRLAQLVAKRFYSLVSTAGHPKAIKLERNGPTLHLSFSETGGKLYFDEPLRQTLPDTTSLFYISANGTDFYQAEVAIQGDTIVLWSPACATPRMVRYDWADFSSGNRLRGANAWPALPFELRLD